MADVRETILVVDKPNCLSDLIIEVLKSNNFIVLQAESGSGCLGTFENVSWEN